MHISKKTTKKMPCLEIKPTIPKLEDQIKTYSLTIKKIQLH